MEKAQGSVGWGPWDSRRAQAAFPELRGPMGTPRPWRCTLLLIRSTPTVPRGTKGRWHVRDIEPQPGAFTGPWSAPGVHEGLP